MKKYLKPAAGVLLLILSLGLFFPIFFGLIQVSIEQPFIEGFMHGLELDLVILCNFTAIIGIGLIIRYALKLINS